eukprot:4220739-Pleurochrysis_carterae.AAC.1
MAAMNHPAWRGPIRLSDLGRDNLELVCCFLPIVTLGAFAPCCKATREAAGSEAVWRAQFSAFAEEYPDLDYEF